MTKAEIAANVDKWCKNMAEVDFADDTCAYTREILRVFLGIVRTCFMVSPQERHTRVGVQSTAPAHSSLHRRPFLGGYVHDNIREPRTR